MTTPRGTTPHVPLVVPSSAPAGPAGAAPLAEAGPYPSDPVAPVAVVPPTVIRTNPPAAPPTYADLPAAPAAYHADQQPEGRRKHRTPLGWLPWALLAGIVLIALLAWLASALADGSDSSNPAATSSSSSAALTSGGANLLAGSSALRGHLGQPATGRHVRVQSVVADEGFWVGSNASNRVFVHLSKASRAEAAESPFQVRAGQAVDLTGTVTRLGGTGTVGVTGAEGLRQLRAQGAYIEALRVSLSS